MSMDLPIIDLDVFLNNDQSSEVVVNECRKVCIFILFIFSDKQINAIRPQTPSSPTAPFSSLTHASQRKTTPHS
jgi:hypothetical protein